MSCLIWNSLSHMSQNECIHLHVCFNVEFHAGAPQGFTLAHLVFAMYTFHWPAIQGSLHATADKLSLSFERHTLYCPSRLTHHRSNRVEPKLLKCSFPSLCSLVIQTITVLKRLFQNTLTHTDIVYCLLSHSLSIMRGITWQWCWIKLSRSWTGWM